MPVISVAVRNSQWQARPKEPVAPQPARQSATLGAAPEHNAGPSLPEACFERNKSWRFVHQGSGNSDLGASGAPRGSQAAWQPGSPAARQPAGPVSPTRLGSERLVVDASRMDGSPERLLPLSLAGLTLLVHFLPHGALAHVQLLVSVPAKSPPNPNRSSRADVQLPQAAAARPARETGSAPAAGPAGRNSCRQQSARLVPVSVKHSSWGEEDTLED